MTTGHAGVRSSEPAAERLGAGARLKGFARACRPRQWLKNVLVFAAPAAAGVLTTPAGLRDTLIAFVAFCLAASGTYLLNDAADAEADRRHPRKRLRPIAAGIVPVGLARVAGVLFIAAAPALAVLAGGWRLPAAVAGYVVLTLAYTYWLKHEAVVDLVAVAGCFLIRAFAGALAVDVPVTSWFLVVVSLGSLQVVVGKREAEMRNQGTAGTRATLVTYTPSYLAHVRSMASGAMIVTYCLWALQIHADTLYGVSIVPFVLIILRHNLLVDRGVGEEPEELALHDRPLQLYTALLIILLVVGIYVK
ncbi:decaprenyl-phosphate phosphoribosyltransferase [Sphaerisporangium rhizosphaerae]|uniref:Decaprenyl-phosphate phosphoribosyltransferase n=1 Tax=Sphaerisporangium rhizosphaerae TaxID=2269375 RepID=A0ABW2PFZ8_9ACTN